MATISPDTLLDVLRAQAWERAKGELQSVLVTYYDGGRQNRFDDLNKLVSDFIKTVDDEGLI